MIAIEDKLISDEVVEQQFVCNLSQCKGGCCVDGDTGAPLTQEEANLLEDIYPKIASRLMPAANTLILEEVVILLMMSTAL